MIEIVCATGGTCVDILTAIMDTRNVELKNSAVWMAPERSRLKKPHNFVDDLAKNDYVNLMSLVYNSIPSHDLDFHVRCCHLFIAITIDKFETALWAAERFKKLHRPHVWEEMQKVCGATNVNEYAQIMMDYSNLVRKHTTKLVALERILDGCAVEDLKQITDLDLNNEFYQQWLKLQHNAC
jgi:L-rhamnose mutarotase